MTVHRSGGITLTPKMKRTDAELLKIGELSRFTGISVILWQGWETLEEAREGENDDDG